MPDRGLYDMGRLADTDREIVRRFGFYPFVKLAWNIVDPTSRYSDNWHIEEICNHCQAVTEHRIKDLMINQPPGTGKSMIVSVLWHPWAWTVRPELRWIFGSFDGTLALDHAEKAFKLLTSQWFVDRWGNLFDGFGGRPAMGDYSNRHGGFRFSTSVEGKGTGRHAHVRVFDDPIKPLDVEGTTKAVGSKLDSTNRWWKNTMASRRVDPSDFASVGVMQRLHENDLSAECVRDGYVRLCLPMRFDPASPSITPIGGDRRSVDGELLDKGRFPEAAVADVEKAMGGRDGPIASAQLQQKPAPPGGLIFKADSFQEFDINQYPFDQTFSCITVDCAFKDAESNSGVAIEVWGMIDAKMMLYESVLGTLSFSSTIEALLSVLFRYPNVNAILIEEKANGAAVIETLRKKISKIIALNPKTSKWARAHAANVYYQARSVYHLAGAQWQGRKESNLKNYPRARRNDDVDATSQALLWLADQSMTDFTRAMSDFTKEGTSTWPTALSQHYSVG